MASRSTDRRIVLVTSAMAVGLLFGATRLRTSASVQLGDAPLPAVLAPAAPEAGAAARLPPAGDAAPHDATAPLVDVAGAFERELDARAALDGGLSCHGRRGFDISGDAAFVWGLTFHVADEVECCRACAAHRLMCAQPSAQGKPYWRTSAGAGRPQVARCGHSSQLCNAFVYCPEERCFSYTPHNHSRHECWLKHEANVTHPIAHGPDFPPQMRAAPRTHWPWAVSNVTWPGAPPERVQWIAGLVLPASERVWVQPRSPSWFVKFCAGPFGPCTRE
ncbi:hypothetical protein KFE25_012300 [Diacronema lutheri]|uniref:Apple domain-containing protein n=1 Tax=Diacronema lutheri TaxID=2081491 RepID=A0A8J5XIP0_DIALT|nr:hypothetical protein KFE25_012300 [Diacronema lutheri]